MAMMIIQRGRKEEAADGDTRHNGGLILVLSLSLPPTESSLPIAKSRGHAVDYECSRVTV